MYRRIQLNTVSWSPTFNNGEPAESETGLFTGFAMKKELKGDYEQQTDADIAISIVIFTIEYISLFRTASPNLESIVLYELFPPLTTDGINTDTYGNQLYDVGLTDSNRYEILSIEEIGPKQAYRLRCRQWT